MVTTIPSTFFLGAVVKAGGHGLLENRVHFPKLFWLSKLPLRNLLFTLNGFPLRETCLETTFAEAACCFNV